MKMDAINRICTWKKAARAGGELCNREASCRRGGEKDSYSEFGRHRHTLLAKYGSEHTHVHDLKPAEVDVLKCIGFGRFSIVKKGYSRKYKEDIAVKIVVLHDKSNRAYVKNYLNQEIRLWRELSAHHGHKNILSLKEHIKTNRYLYVVTEVMNRGNLHNYLLKTTINELRGKCIFRDVVEAVCYCHGKQIAHRDIKPENILMCKGETVKLGDFSFVTKANPVTNEHCGTRVMLSPEQRAGRSYNPFVSDVWQVGLTLYTMLFRRLPYKNHKKKLLLSEIQRTPDLYRGVPYPNSNLSTDCKDLISDMLTIDPLSRPTIEDVKASAWMSTVVVLPEKT